MHSELFLRKWARLIAYIDLGLAALATVMLTLNTFYVTGVIPVAKKDVKIAEPRNVKAIISFVYVYWAYVGISAVFICLHIWLARNLIRATKIGIEASEAWTRSKRWRSFNTVLVVLTAVGNIFILNEIYYGVSVFIVRLCLIYIIHIYVKELHPLAM